MRVPQEFINLLNLPMDQLLDIAEKLDVNVPKGAKKWDVARSLSRVSSRKLTPLASEWIFAGRTSVSYVKLGDGSALKEAAVVGALTDICDGLNPLKGDIRPQVLSAQPALVDVVKSNGKFFLTFGFKKPVAQVLTDFEVEEVQSDEFFVAVIRSDKAIVEIRTNYQRAERLTNQWIAELTQYLFAADSDQYSPIGISDAELDRLRAELGARVDRIRGKGEEGKDVDTVEVTRSPWCPDLSGSQEADERVDGTSPARVDFLIDRDGLGDDRLRVSTRHGSIWFVNAVPEAVIDDVFEALCRVKGI